MHTQAGLHTNGRHIKRQRCMVAYSVEPPEQPLYYWCRFYKSVKQAQIYPIGDHKSTDQWDLLTVRHLYSIMFHLVYVPPRSNMHCSVHILVIDIYIYKRKSTNLRNSCKRFLYYVINEYRLIYQITV